MLVKFCGITRWEDYQQAKSVGASYVGFIFYPKSPRYLDDEKQANFIEALKVDEANEVKQGEQIKRVGVFVNEPLDKVIELVEAMALEAVQVHGDEDIAYFVELKKKLELLEARLKKKIVIWNCVKLSSAMSGNTIQREVANLEHYLTLTEWILLENKSDKYGGTGDTIDEAVLHSFLTQSSHFKTIKIILSGGLNKDNVTARINWWRENKFTLPTVLDFNSGAEVSPGVKSHVMMQKIMDTVGW